MTTTLEPYFEQLLEKDLVLIHAGALARIVEATTDAGGEEL